ncbi:MAG: alpha/beta hydrolase [Alphaproteobacteria bacterium]|nr:alpha/beta hydrolase [Alphaproteobacteria bacterium]
MPRTVLLVPGPPTGPDLWTQVQKRLAPRHATRVATLLDAAEAEPTVGGQAAWLADRIASLRSDGELAVVAHGLAVPVALRATPSEVPLVLCNGPIRAGGPAADLAGALLRSLPLLAPVALNPAISLRFLASSAGLRRAVRNPYVMDHDTVVTVCGNAFVDGAARRRLARFLADLPAALRSTPGRGGPTLALWGDEDRLHPASAVDELRLLAPATTHIAVPGGRLMHPVERPWEVADAVAAWLADLRDPVAAG